jgi:hypothetical protein
MDEKRIQKEILKLQAWQRTHEQEANRRFDEIDHRLTQIPSKDDIEKIVKEAIIEGVIGIGKTAKFTLITVATLIGAIVVISGGFKWLLGFIGFTYLGK